MGARGTFDFRFLHGTHADETHCRLLFECSEGVEGVEVRETSRLELVARVIVTMVQTAASCFVDDTSIALVDGIRQGDQAAAYLAPCSKQI